MRLKKQHGLGFTYVQEGGNIFQAVKRYGFPALKYIYHNVLKPFIKNNQKELLGIATNLVSKHREKPTLKEVIETIKEDTNLLKIRDKSLAEHFRGEGLNKKSKRILKSLYSGKGLKLLSNK